MLHSIHKDIENLNKRAVFADKVNQHLVAVFSDNLHTREWLYGTNDVHRTNLMKHHMNVYLRILIIELCVIFDDYRRKDQYSIPKVLAKIQKSDDVGISTVIPHWSEVSHANLEEFKKLNDGYEIKNAADAVVVLGKEYECLKEESKNEFDQLKKARDKYLVHPDVQNEDATIVPCAEFLKTTVKWTLGFTNLLLHCCTESGAAQLYKNDQMNEFQSQHAERHRSFLRDFGFLLQKNGTA